MYRDIPFSPPDITDLEISNVIDVLRSGWITTGAQTKLFEKKLAESCTTEKAVCLNSATACMELVLRMFGIGPGDEVITCSYTYTASASVACHVGAKLVLVDAQTDDFHMDYDKLAEAITENTKAIIPIDIAGILCDYDRIYEIVNSKRQLFHAKNQYQEALGRILVLADSAHGFGASYKGKKSGAVADFTCFSFHAVKNITTGEGGAITWRPDIGLDSGDIYKQFMLLSLHGQSKDAWAKLKPSSWEYDVILPGYKCNMTDISAAIGLGQLERYDGLLKKRKKLIQAYNDNLPQDKITVLQHDTENQSSSGHLYLTRLKGKNLDFRNRFIQQMSQAGVACNVHYKPLPMHTAYKQMGFNIQDFPNSYTLFENEVTLPLNSKMTVEDVCYVAEHVRRLLLSL